MTCAGCGAELRPGARFCGACGATARGEVLDAAACEACGRTVRPEARFCGGCGAPRSQAAGQSDVAALAGPVLYVAPEALRSSLADALTAALGGVNRGRVLWVSRGDALTAVQQALAHAGGGLEAVCLIGDAEVLPHVRLPDPCGYDEALWTDAPYGMRSSPTADERLAGDVLPDVPVARLPTRDPALLRRLLRARDLAAGWDRAVAVSAAVWEGPSRAVLERLGAAVDCHLAPPADRAPVREAMARAPGRLYFNVHGTDQDAVWLGEGAGRYPEVLRPADFAPHQASGARVAPNAVLFSEACYGADLGDGPDGLAHTFLASGVSAFVGSTVIAWGAGPGHPPALADELAVGFFRHLDAGQPAVRALHLAKSDLALAALAIPGGLSAPLHNTLLSFGLYGAPLARVAGAHRGPPPAPKVLDDARDRLRTRLRPDDWKLLTSGRLTLAALKAQLRTDVRPRLAALLGGPPLEARVVRYGAAPGPATVFASGGGPVPRRVALELDASGRVTRELVSR